MDSDSFDGRLGEIVEEKEEDVFLGIEDIVLQLKYGDGDELRIALAGLRALVMETRVDGEWLADEGLISILFSRLSSNQSLERPAIIKVLRSIASQSVEVKERMADLNYLTAIVKSLARGSEERREAVGLLVELAHLSTVRRRVGRIKGCILMLVTIRNGDDDPFASYDAEKLLNVLSKNTQNALHMAEAGYFIPMIQHLKEGSEMSKILMATSLSRMALTDQTRASLGDRAIEPLITMLKRGNLESKSAAINALQNLSILKDNIPHMFAAGMLSPLLQLLFSVTSSLMSLREPASVLLSRVSLSDSILSGKDICGQLLSLLNLSSPSVQLYVLQALNNIASHPAAFKARREMKQSGITQLLLPFLSESSNYRLRTGALDLLYTISKDSTGDLDGLLEEANLVKIVSIVAKSDSNDEKAAAASLLSNVPISDKKATETLKRTNLLLILIALMNPCGCLSSTATVSRMAESVASILIRFTVSTDQKLQLYALDLGVVPLLVKLLSSGTIIAKCRAATSLAQLSQNSHTLRRSTVSRWVCIPPSKDAYCEVHGLSCSSKGGFCLIRAGAFEPLMEILDGEEREADEAALSALSTLVQDALWEKGSIYIAKKRGIEGVLKVLETGRMKAKEKALWILENIFRVEAHRFQYGESAQLVQSSYFSGEACLRKNDKQKLPLLSAEIQIKPQWMLWERGIENFYEKETTRYIVTDNSSPIILAIAMAMAMATTVLLRNSAILNGEGKFC
ncbi:hypothetical protein V2J09_003337 [Rumex salicifolius]